MQHFKNDALGPLSGRTCWACSIIIHDHHQQSSSTIFVYSCCRCMYPYIHICIQDGDHDGVSHNHNMRSSAAVYDPLVLSWPVRSYQWPHIVTIHDGRWWAMLMMIIMILTFGEQVHVVTSSDDHRMWSAAGLKSGSLMCVSMAVFPRASFYTIWFFKVRC